MSTTGSITIFDRTQTAIDSANAAAALPEADFNRVIRVEQDGLHVGDTQSSSEALIDSESFNVVISGKKYSKLAANYVQFGNYRILKASDGGLRFQKVGGTE